MGKTRIKASRDMPNVFFFLEDGFLAVWTKVMQTKQNEHNIKKGKFLVERVVKKVLRFLSYLQANKFA